jgi:hypothetical protein
MRSSSSASFERPVPAIAAVVGYTALVTLVVTTFTTSGFVASVAGALTVGLLVGSYLVERWARRRTVYSAGSPTSPEITTPAEDDDESRMAKI